MHVRMERDYTYDLDAKEQPGVTRTIPAGWVGELDDDVGADAVAVGAAVDTTPPVPEKTARKAD